MYFSAKKTAIAHEIRCNEKTYAEIAKDLGCSTRTVARVAVEMAAGRYGLMAEKATEKPQTEAEAKKALSALIAELEDYYKEA